MALLMLNIPWAGCDGWGRAFLLWVGQWKIKLGKVHLEKIQPVKYTLEKYLENTLWKYAPWENTPWTNPNLNDVGHNY